MQKMTKYLIICVSFILFVIITMVAKAQQCTPQAAKAVVEQFFKYDFQGYRLSSEGHEAIWKLTSDELAEPPNEPIVVIKNYKIQNATRGKDGYCIVNVHFESYGYIDQGDDGSTFHRANSQKDVSVFVKCSSKACLIDVDPSRFKISPYVSKEAAIALFKHWEQVSGNPKTWKQKDQAIIRVLQTLK